MSDPTKRTMADWNADLDISEAEADAGLTVPLQPLLQHIRDDIAAITAGARIAMSHPG